MHLARDLPDAVPAASVTVSSSSAMDSSVPSAKEAAVPAAKQGTDSRSYPWHETDSIYGLQHELQNYDICLPRPLKESSKEDTVWVIFLHGGAWRDPEQDKSELQPALTQFLSSPSSPTLSHIAGFASLNYGLSRYPPTDTSQPLSQRVQYPKHISDVIVALGLLGRKYEVGRPGGYKYILVGHSAGATIAFQTITYVCSCASHEPAVGIVGLAGIYDLGLVVENHAEEPFYRMMVENAFTADTHVWDSASPVNGREKFGEAREKGGLLSVVLGASEGDVLIEREQWVVMQKALEEQGWKTVDAETKSEEDERKEIVLLPLEGTHDEIWERGDGVRKSIELAISRLFPSKKSS